PHRAQPEVARRLGAAASRSARRSFPPPARRVGPRLLERDAVVVRVGPQPLAQLSGVEAPLLGAVAVLAELPLRLLGEVAAHALGVLGAELAPHALVGRAQRRDGVAQQLLE